MRIAVDLDDVVVELVKEMLVEFNKFTAQAYPSSKTRQYTQEDIRIYEVWKSIPITEENFYSILKRLRTSGRLANLDAVPNAVDSIHRLQSLGNDIYFTTSRDPVNLRQTYEWLDKHNLPAWKTIFTGLDKARWVKRADISLIVDDNPDIIKDCSEKGIVSIVYDRPWNRDLDPNVTLHRVGGWIELEKGIIEKGF